MPLIRESFALVASDADILAAPSRLAAIPANGVLTVEISATDNDGVNFGQLTVQLPGGDIPLQLVQIPFSGSSTEGMLDSNTELVVVMQVPQGGHVILQYVENGTVVQAFLHVSLQF